MLSKKQKESSDSGLTGQGVERSAAVKGQGMWGSFEGKDGDSVWGSRKESEGRSRELQRRVRASMLGLTGKALAASKLALSCPQ